MNTHDDAELIAYTALTALREPDEGMVKAGERGAWDHDNHMPAIHGFVAGWQAAIDAALGE